MKPVKFYFGDDPLFDGFADGTTWNGFDNVWITADTMKQITDYFRADYQSAGYHGADLAEVMECFDIEPDADGLYSLANGFATSIEE